jgi:hypothetical protein
MPAWWMRGGAMPSVEERLAYLEGKVDDHRAASGDLHAAVGDVRISITELRGDVRTSMTELRARMDRRFETLDQKVDRNFSWSVGIQVAVLLAVVSALVGSYFR